MKRIFQHFLSHLHHATALLTLLLALAAAFPAGARVWDVASVTNPHLADSTRFTANPDGVLSSAAVAEIDSRLRALQRNTTAEMAVVALDSISPSTDIDSFATKLFNSWGLGKSDTDNGVLLLLVKSTHNVTIRTGKGTEGVVPDIIAGRIIRNDMIPHFRTGNYDRGVIAGVESIGKLLSDPELAGELISDRSNNRGPGSEQGHPIADSLFSFYLFCAAAGGAAMLLIVVWRIRATRRDDHVARYRALEHLATPALFMSFICLGFALPAWLILRFKLRGIRNHRRKCPRCGTEMTRLNEEADNAYLTPAQDSEERLNSVDYDVWLCPRCQNTEVIPYFNKASAYSECPNCHARAMSLHDTRTVRPATPLSEGRGEKTYTCRHCGFRKILPFAIPIIITPPVRRRGGGGGFGGGGGGFGGGSFGGGSSMGGGATGSW